MLSDFLLSPGAEICQQVSEERPQSFLSPCHLPVGQELSPRLGFHWSFWFSLGLIFSRLKPRREQSWVVGLKYSRACRRVGLHVGAAVRVTNGLAEEQSCLSVSSYSVRKRYCCITNYCSILHKIDG